MNCTKMCTNNKTKKKLKKQSEKQSGNEFSTNAEFYLESLMDTNVARQQSSVLDIFTF